MSVVELKTRPVEVNESVIARLEEVLQEARVGEIVAVGIAVVNKDGSISCGWSEADEFSRLLGSVTRLQHKLNLRADNE